MNEAKQVVSVDEVLSYLGIDYVDNMVSKNIERLIKTADAYLKGSIGDDYPVDDPKAKELALIIISDLYDNRGMHPSTGGNNNLRRLVEDLSLQLRLERRRGSDE